MSTAEETRQWRAKNIDRERIKWREYKEKNKDKINNYLKEYNKEHSDKHKEYCKKRYSDNAEVHKLAMREYRKKYPEKARAIRERQAKKIKDSWREYFPKETNCECCGTKIFFSSGKCSTSICFDHKKEGLPIKCSPANFLKAKIRNNKNQEIWESCKFGMLCNKCNIVMPTANRKEWLANITRYINKD